MARPGHYDCRQGRIRRHHVCCYCGAVVHAGSRQPHGIRHEPYSDAARERVLAISKRAMSSGVCAVDMGPALAAARAALRLVGVA